MFEFQSYTPEIAFEYWKVHTHVTSWVQEKAPLEVPKLSYWAPQTLTACFGPLFTASTHGDKTSLQFIDADLDKAANDSVNILLLFSFQNSYMQAE